MKKVILSLLLLMTASIFGLNPERFSFNFENCEIGKIPSGWKVEATNRKKGLERWEVISDKRAPSGNKVLAMVDPEGAYGNMYNICWTEKISFLNGEISVKFKAIRGKEDEGGGIIWRVKDKNNYYIARFNPLEDNFRMYYVKNGQRRMLKTARVKLKPGKWISMKIIQKGNHYECFLNGEKFLEGIDNTFKNPGGIGLWTKSDAVTYFDNLNVLIY